MISKRTFLSSYLLCVMSHKASMAARCTRYACTGTKGLPCAPLTSQATSGVAQTDTRPEFIRQNKPSLRKFLCPLIHSTLRTELNPLKTIFISAENTRQKKLAPPCPKTLRQARAGRWMQARTEIRSHESCGTRRHGIPRVRRIITAAIDKSSPRWRIMHSLNGSCSSRMRPPAAGTELSAYPPLFSRQTHERTSQIGKPRGQ